MTETEPLSSLTPGMPVIVGGDRVVHVSDELAAAFAPGDRLLTLDATGDLLHVPAAESAVVEAAVSRAAEAFGRMGATSDESITAFFDRFAARLADDAVFAAIADANAADVESARSRGRSVTRLILSEKMRADMIAGLHTWRDQTSTRGQVVERVDHDGWSVEMITAGLGVVGFVFEGRPNVFADATGVLRGGNAVVFRIGSDALGTARAIVEHALDPAIADAGLPPGVVGLVDSPSRAAGWALFADARLSLAVARGSGAAVAQLGAVANQAGTPVSLHGTGGAWMIAGEGADADALGAAVIASLDRKVCNTLNVCAVTAARAEELVPIVLAALDIAAGRRNTNAKLHVAAGSERHIAADLFETKVPIARADGEVDEPAAETIAIDDLGTEWEWEDSPEISVVVVDSVDDGVDLFNRLSPRLVATLISDDDAEQSRFWSRIDAPFVGNGMTRWVDGQYALDRPELGLSNWENGRLFARGGVLSGDSVFTIRTRATQTDPHLSR